MRLKSLLFIFSLSLLSFLSLSLVNASSQSSEQLKKSAESHEFQTEVSRLMKLIINSLYKTKEIFLRELISNASDALDKIRYAALLDKKVLGDTQDLKITIVANKENKTLTITDFGVGMTKDDLKKNLGTIAKSGTAEFLAQLEKGKGDVGLIGQFGVGFYSVFLVADTVTVTTKNNEDDQYIWESDSESGFSIVKDPRGNTLGRGTEITLYLKEDASEYLEDATLKGLIQKYSEFINFPIYLYTTKTVTEEVPVEDTEEDEEKKEEKKDDEEEEELNVEEKKTEEEEKPKTKTIEKTISEFEQINVNKPIWTRSPSKVTEEEYNNFYKGFTKDTTDPMAYTHFRAEGEIEFKSILFVPKTSPVNPLNAKPENYVHNIKLFVKRVFITDELLDFLPQWLSFLKGLIDSDDFPLNVSRETLQQSKIMKIVRKKVIAKAVELIKKLSKDEKKWEEFYSEYSTNIKLGLIEDSKNAKKLFPLMKFHSSLDNGTTNLEDYVDRMKKGQKDIYYITGLKLEEVKKSPFIESLVSRGYEVLYFVDPIDEYWLQRHSEYEGHKFQDVTKASLKIDETEEEKKEMEALESKFKPLTTYIEKLFDSSYEKVSISTRLTKSPLTIVASNYGASPTWQRIMMSQAGGSKDAMRSYLLSQKQLLEINPYHPIMEKLLAKVEDDAMTESENMLVKVLVDSAVIGGGWHVADPTGFVDRVERAVRVGLGVDLNAKAKVVVKKAEEKEKKEGDDDEDEKRDEKDEAKEEEEELERDEL
ncbi:heat-shock protein 90 [Paraphysoderma sedebokerense]|nr:heat-shock protein 90 [Paraphysoderma sedebokerense]